VTTPPAAPPARPFDRLCPWLAALLLALAAGLHLAYLAFGGPLDLSPDEAHYWDWSRHLDWSYYSKGPLVAWVIRASCDVLGPWSEAHTGNLTFAVRAPAVLCGTLLVASLYVLCAEVLQRPRLGLALVAGALTMPPIAAGSLLMTIDSPYTCCWGWALVFAHRAVTRDHLGYWAATGVVTSLGILAKYTMVLFPAALALLLLTGRDTRRLLFSRGFAVMAALSLLSCVPILIWNAQNDWVTFHHVGRLAGSGSRGVRWLGPLHYLGGQAALLLGYWFAVWAVAMVACNPLRERGTGFRYLWWLSAPVFLLFLAFSLKTGGGELNWPVTAYLSGGVLAVAWLARQLESPRAWYRRGVAVCITGTLLIGLTLTVLIHCTQVVHPLLRSVAGAPTPTRPYPVRRFDPTCRLRGWRHLAACVDDVRHELRRRGVEPVLAGVAWTTPGELGVYCAGHPQAYTLGLLQGDRHSQYDLWANPIDHPELFRGRTFLVVGPIGPGLEAGFERVEAPRQVRYEVAGRPVVGWTLHVCHGFKGFKEVRSAPH
jgi:hypothetical protein